MASVVWLVEIQSGKVHFELFEPVGDLVTSLFELVRIAVAHKDIWMSGPDF